MKDYLYHTTPFKHQHEAFIKYRDAEFWGHLWEQGLGKSKIIIDTSAYLYANGKIDLLLIISPSGVNRNWVINEIPTHCPDYINASAAWYASVLNKADMASLDKTINHTTGLKVITFNIESMATKNGTEFIKKLLLSFRCMLVIDESHIIKSNKAIRTKTILKLAKHAKYRRILTGTPVGNGSLDLYTQFTFLDSQVLRCNSYYAFRNEYAEMKEINTAGRSFKVITGYKNLDQLSNLISKCSDRLTKKECLDLPEKLYAKRYVELSDNQRKLYNSLKKDICAEFNGKSISAPLALTRLLRLQQITGGFFQPDIAQSEENEDLFISMLDIGPEPIDKVNPRIESVIELLQETQGKVIIWSKFRIEIKHIVERIIEEFGPNSVCEYHGGVSKEDRSANITAFQNNPELRFFVANKAASTGITLTAASTVIFYSNDYSYIDRSQEEDRNHRIGTLNPVTYIDLIAPRTLDEKIVETLRNKKSVSDSITLDDPINWI
jgi:SNF2 family DNA or RNA helicase